MQKHLINNAWNKFLNRTGHPKGQSSIVDQNVHSCHPSSLHKEAQQKQQEGPPPVDFGALGHMILWRAMTSQSLHSCQTQNHSS